MAWLELRRTKQRTDDGSEVFARDAHYADATSSGGSSDGGDGSRVIVHV
jgi:hypothetical protein